MAKINFAKICKISKIFDLLDCVNPFVANAPFLSPLKTSEKIMVF